MICVECGEAVSFTYSGIPGGIRLYQCHSCRKTADKYCEYDFINLALDLILHRISAYRHLLFNRMDISRANFASRDTVRIACVAVLLDAYVGWFTRKASDEDSAFASKPMWSVNALTSQLPALAVGAAVVDFGFFLCGILLGTRLAVKVLFERGSKTMITMVNYHHAVVSVVISTYGKLGILLMAIWDCEMQLRYPIAVFVATSNIIALKASLGHPSVLPACIIVAMGHASRQLSQRLVWLLCGGWF